MFHSAKVLHFSLFPEILTTFAAYKRKTLMKKRKALLIILDGWGLGDGSLRDVISSSPTPYWDYLLKTCPHSKLSASGEDVGLPEGQMGNSEVGHLNIGAGRVVYQDLVKINRACRDGSFAHNEEVVRAYGYARETGRSIHILGLVSDGGVHSSLEHFFKLVDVGNEYGIKNLFVHCFTDGRDTDPRSGLGFVSALDKHMKSKTGRIASVVGRYYAMDRDNRWDRIKVAYDLLTSGVGYETEDVLSAIEKSYSVDGVTDEFIRPIVVTEGGKPVATIRDGDVVIFANFRNDRAKELTVALTQKDMPDHGMQVFKNLQFFTMTPYDATFKGLHILFNKENVVNTLGEYLSKAGLRQLHIAETEKYAHVTFFLNGGREAPFAGEDRILVPSPKVSTYDLQPEMSAFEVCARLVDALKKRVYDFAVVNFANGDMVGHTGVYKAIEKAVCAVDVCIGSVITVAKANGYDVILIADHGNADFALNDDGSPNTAHSLSPVPFIYISDRERAAVDDGRLADVAPSVLHVLGLSQPYEMDGKNLIRS
jgi:2,3-bisphosphoglycerate-independent phosphoglycerate mutase